MKLDFTKICIFLARNGQSITDMLDCVSRQAIINIKHGKRTRVKTAARIADFLQCDITDIMKPYSEQE